MFSNYLQITIPLIGLMINVFTQIVYFRYMGSLKLLKSVFFGFIIGLLSIFLLEFYVLLNIITPSLDFIAILVTDIIIYFSLGYCYFNFINLGETARRIRILRELYDSKDGLVMEEILERYNSKEIINNRVDRLIANGQVLYREGRYYIGKSAILLIAKIMVMMKIIFIGKRSEFD
jgi:hypothetical protein